MKRILSCISIILCIAIGAACFTACNSTNKWVRPEFSIENQGYSIELTTNMQSDFQFPINGIDFKYEKFQNDGLLEYCWVIKDSGGDIVGWIETGNGYESKNGNYQFGFCTTRADGKLTFDYQHIVIIMQGKDFSVFDTLTLKSNYGTITKVEGEYGQYPATDRYRYYVQEEDATYYNEGAENFVCCDYLMAFDGVDAKAVDSIKINLNF